ncbi:cytochrome D ubiquinol oxidase subunit II [Dictyobacter alpinus]|uniref:Cytochrome D ubiquinol oxidase subunit II n=1 Tax=Dictyobacter alpinus TaxID=2014873 RepID=A0A402BEZ0_9CHLR|nr:cytochrome d ubiquinol oxidase subunit II [Dictyobacter alpinus]GCE29899.1 cytochrome D ubiquinol oxidase subunit II [Dictyobacter alpinus]
MQTLWFILVGGMLTAYVVMDGFDLGAGIIHLFAGRSDTDRRLIIGAIGPVWDGNEVWLIAAGGTLFFSFPLLYASSFSGFYLPLMIVLWLLMLRGIAIELRSHFPNPVWTSFWDGLFFIGSTLLTIFYGAAMANVLRGVPLDGNGYFFEALWTDFNPFSAHPGILDWYTILIGLLALTILTAHGATYIAVKVPDPLSTRSRKVALLFVILSFVLAIPGTIATWAVQPQISRNYFAHPWGFIFPLLALGALVAMGYFNLTRRDLLSFFSSCAFIIGLLSSAAFGIYPLMLPAVNTEHSLTIHNASASAYGQTVGLVWWIFGMVLAIIYFVVTYRLFWGKVSIANRARE